MISKIVTINEYSDQQESQNDQQDQIKKHQRENNTKQHAHVFLDFISENYSFFYQDFMENGNLKFQSLLLFYVRAFASSCNLS